MWLSILKNEFLQRNIPVPLSGWSRPIDLLSSKDLERIIMRAYQLHQRWTSASPQPLRQVQISRPRSRVIALQFIELSGHPYLLSVSLVEPAASGPRIFECWDLAIDPPFCVARRLVTNSRGHGFFSFNQERSNGAVMALRLDRLASIYSLFEVTNMWGH